MRLILWGILFFVSFFSCNNNYIFEDYYHFPDEEWMSNNTANFSFSIDDASVSYDLYFKIRHTNEYAKANLWVFINTFVNGELIKKDTLECLLAEPNGKWIGAGFGGTYESTHSIKSSYKFPDTSKISVQIEHAMRTEKLLGVKAMGFFIERKKNNNGEK